MNNRLGHVISRAACLVAAMALFGAGPGCAAFRVPSRFQQLQAGPSLAAAAPAVKAAAMARRLQHLGPAARRRMLAQMVPITPS